MVEEALSAVTKPPRVLVIDHHDSYVWNLVHLIASVTSVLPDVVQNGPDVSLDGYTHVVLSPGPGHPNEYDWSILDIGLPVLGVCLGMQALVTHYGGTVAAIEPAHGVVSSIRHQDLLFGASPQDFAAVRYHSLAATALSENLLPIAWSEDRVIMGVRHRSLPQIGVQFHPESILSEFGDQIIRNFLEMR
ncbi:MAG TPA: aminodeoxychorismate/anthranilate synthase component II [Marmoricola sp.]|nr:aminodeoxychorismate/anthranilate synthase component II [Marmoricola sp.]